MTGFRRADLEPIALKCQQNAAQGAESARWANLAEWKLSISHPATTDPRSPRSEGPHRNRHHRWHGRISVGNEDVEDIIERSRSSSVVDLRLPEPLIFSFSRGKTAAGSGGLSG